MTNTARNITKQILIFLAAIAALMLLSCSADVSFGESLASSLDADVTSRYIFYAYNPEDYSDATAVERSYGIGSTLDMATLSFDELSAIRTGYTFLGWTYYNNPVTGSTDLPATIHVDDDQYVTDVTVTPSPASFVAVWHLAYEDYGTCTVTIMSDDIGIASATGSSVVTLTAASGYESYRWFIDGSSADSVSGATVSGNVLTLAKSQLVRGYVYQVTVYAQKNGFPYSAQVQVEVTE